MAERLTFPDASAAWLKPHLPPADPSASNKKPFVTLTYAQSLDSALALAPGLRTRLSGPESKAMTHYLRSKHAAILIGVSTMLADNPGLNCRIEGAPSHPRPIVIDPRARWVPKRSDKVFELYREGEGLAPFVLTGVSSSQLAQDQVDVLSSHGGKYIHINATQPDGMFEWGRILEMLHQEGLGSVMVEGGAKVINSLLSPECQQLVDSVIVTIAPTWMGQGGVVVSPARSSRVDGSANDAAARLKSVSWHPLGEDVVVCGRLTA